MWTTSVERQERLEGSQNAVGEIEDDLLIIAADKELSTTATEVTQMLEGTPAFSGIGGTRRALMDNGIVEIWSTHFNLFYMLIVLLNRFISKSKLIN